LRNDEFSLRVFTLSLLSKNSVETFALQRLLFFCSFCREYSSHHRQSFRTSGHGALAKRFIDRGHELFTFWFYLGRVLAMNMVNFFSGATAMASAMIALLFFRLYTRSLERLFLIFSFAFVLFCVERIVLSATNPAAEYFAYVYMIRLLAFLFIIYAVADKNLRKS
jgi:hypothetical protein